MSLSDYKDTIHRVYIEEDRTLDDLMRFMNEEFGILARYVNTHDPLFH
jgi:hypothetical protein